MPSHTKLAIVIIFCFKRHNFVHYIIFELHLQNAKQLKLRVLTLVQYPQHKKAFNVSDGIPSLLIHITLQTPVASRMHLSLRLLTSVAIHFQVVREVRGVLHQVQKWSGHTVMFQCVKVISSRCGVVILSCSTV